MPDNNVPVAGLPGAADGPHAREMEPASGPAQRRLRHLTLQAPQTSRQAPQARLRLLRQVAMQ